MCSLLSSLQSFIYRLLTIGKQDIIYVKCTIFPGKPMGSTFSFNLTGKLRFFPWNRRELYKKCFVLPIVWDKNILFCSKQSFHPSKHQVKWELLRIEVQPFIRFLRNFLPIIRRQVEVLFNTGEHMWSTVSYCLKNVSFQYSGHVRFFDQFSHQNW